MAILEHSFNVDELKEVSGAGAAFVPEGKYLAVITEDEWKDVQGGSNKYIAMSVKITDGDYAGTVLIDRLNVINDNKTAVEIAYSRLGNISKALGMTETPKDTAKLHNRPLVIEVVTEPGKPWTDRDGNQRDGKDKSNIKKYYPLTERAGHSAPGIASQAPAQQAKPW